MRTSAGGLLPDLGRRLARFTLAFALALGSAALPTGAAAPGQVVWQTEVPALTAPPQLGDGLLYLFAGNDVLALDVAGGVPVWSVQPPAPTARALAVGCCPAGAAPTAGGLYTLAGGATLLALDPATGAVRWQQTLGDAVLAPPVASSGVVSVLALAGADAALHGLDAATGEPLWRAALPSDRLLPTLTLVGDTVFAQQRDGQVLAYGLADGELRWLAGPTGRGRVLLPRQFAPELLVLPRPNGLVALDLASGAERWSRDLPGSVTDLVATDDAVYAPLFEGWVVALGLADGAERWRTEVGRYRVSALAGPVDGRLYLAGWDGLVALDAATGARLWEWAGAPVFVPPLVADGVVYLGTATGDLVVLDPATGGERARFSLGGRVLAEPIPLTDELLLLLAEADRATHVVALRRSAGDEREGR